MSETESGIVYDRVYHIRVGEGCTVSVLCGDQMVAKPISEVRPGDIVQETGDHVVDQNRGRYYQVCQIVHSELSGDMALLVAEIASPQLTPAVAMSPIFLGLAGNSTTPVTDYLMAIKRAAKYRYSDHVYLLVGSEETLGRILDTVLKESGLPAHFEGRSQILGMTLRVCESDLLEPGCVAVVPYTLYDDWERAARNPRCKLRPMGS